MAVDKEGNVLSFTQKGGLLALQFGISTNAGLGISGNMTLYNENIPDLKTVLGRFHNFDRE